MGHEEMLMYPNEYRVMFELEDRYWWYRGVRTLLRMWLDRYAPHPALILDGGCGTGANLQLLQQYGTALGIDIAESAIDFCRARGIAPERLALASLSELPFPDNFFDVVISFEVICNIADDQRAFDEIARVLKSGGYAIIQVPAYQWLWSHHDIAVGHQRRYAARDLRAKIERAGMTVSYTHL
ncbi:MAG: class I SAM-dependent methyltransferase, partial [Anaerolineae bacterium]|nr:class I SAM-dependent methyltransferase [Anaerolineae bacterium]